jgi:hypothetical protein
MEGPIYSVLSGKEPVSRQISGSLTNAQQIAGATGTITPYTKQTSSCGCGVGGTIYYIITSY